MLSMYEVCELLDATTYNCSVGFMTINHYIKVSTLMSVISRC